MPGMRMRPEEEIVLLSSLAERDAEQEERLRSLLSEGSIDWQFLWERASVNQVLPLFARVLLSVSTIVALPQSVIDNARAIRLRTIFSNMSAREELARIGSLLASRGVPCVPLKGTHLAERLYHRLDSRQTGDIDILVPRSALETARSVLAQLGYAPATGVLRHPGEHTFHGVPYVRSTPAGGYAVELHWELNNPRFVSIDYERLWQRVLTAGSSEQALRPLPSEETLLFLALHLAKHSRGVLRLLADIDRLVRQEGPSIDWQYTLALAERWRVSSLLYFALLHAQTLLSTPVQPWIMARLKPVTWRRAMVGLLIGPDVILRAPGEGHVHSDRFDLAYSIMLSSLRRSFDAYIHYLFPPVVFQGPFVLGRPVGMALRLTRGVAWTGLVFASCLAGWVRARQI
ncbi:MAG: hypothetical protein EPO21_10915 [Chloroflexota bacterium]|nr:MAG: hypothetical protein EPO21_10915 [Chloroflexota bacterium]